MLKTSFNIPSEFFSSFNDITFYDEPHKYFIGKQELISVTTIIHKYQEEFNEDYWSNYKGEEFNISQREILRAWKFINEKGTMKGSAIHDYAEKLFLNKKYEYPKKMIVNHFGFDPIYKEYEITRKHVDKFHKDTRNKLIPIRTEMIIYDRESLIAGMVDMLFWNVKHKILQLYDWKTNKDFTFEMKSRHLLGDLFMIEDCDLELYSLQLDLYKYIIEKNTGIKLGQSYLVWFSHNNDNYKIIETKDRSYYAQKIVENRIMELKGF